MSGNVPAGGAVAPPAALSPADARAEIDGIRADPKHAYFDQSAIGHQAALDRVSALYGMLDAPAGGANGVRAAAPGVSPAAGSAQPVAGMTPADALAEIGRILGDPRHPYYDPRSPEHAAAKERVQALYEARFAATAEEEADILARSAGEAMAVIEDPDFAKLDLAEVESMPELKETLTPMLQAVGANQGDVAVFVQAYNEFRAIPEGDRPAAVERWKSETTQFLERTYGDGADRRRDELNAFVTITCGPKAIEFVHAIGLAGNPSFVRALDRQLTRWLGGRS